MKEPRIALVHDDLTQYGGAERILELLHQIFPKAPLYTTVYAKKEMRAQGFNDTTMEIRTSFLQKLPKSMAKYYLPFYPLAIESFDLTGFDVIISSSSRYALGALTAPESLHICFCHSPARFLWNFPAYEKGHHHLGLLRKTLVKPVLHRQRIWDQLAAQRPDHFVVFSKQVAKMIEKFYRRKADLLFGAINVDAYVPQHKIEKENSYLLISRLVAHKRVDLAIDAFRLLGANYTLKIVGEGEQRAKLERNAPSHVQFLGFVPESTKIALLQKARALIFPQIEDFGLTAIEANAAGTPVIGFGRGGLLETTKAGETALYFDEPTAEALASCIRSFRPDDYSPAACIAQARQFSQERFAHSIRSYIQSAALQ